MVIKKNNQYNLLYMCVVRVRNRQRVEFDWIRCSMLFTSEGEVNKQCDVCKMMKWTVRFFFLLLYMIVYILYVEFFIYFFYCNTVSNVRFLTDNAFMYI